MKNEKGITMIALIITIIVMVILAGAAIMTVVGDDAVVKKAKEGVSESNIAQAQEEVEAAWADLEMGFWMDTNDTKRSDYFTSANLETSLKGTGTILEEKFSYVPGGMTTGIYVKDGVEYSFELDTTNHTDVTADSFASTNGGYGDGADIVPNTNTISNTITETPVEKKYELSGAWRFNDVIDLSESFDTDEDGVEGMVVQGIKFDAYYYIPSLDEYRLEGERNEIAAWLEEGYEEIMYDGYTVYMIDIYNGWAESYQVNIDFGDTPQEVTEEFYVWFTANAVKQ